MKNSNESIRCKFSIDGGFPQKHGRSRPSTISKPYGADFGNPTFTICVKSTVRRAPETREYQVFRAWRARLSVSLISL
jgi:hypothetical protein